MLAGLLTPFGAIMYGATGIGALLINDLQKLVTSHRLVILRGFGVFTREEFLEWGSCWGNVMTWKYGQVLDLRVTDDPCGTFAEWNGPVPLHWDGAVLGLCPRIQILQCVKAPIPCSGGETYFVNTAHAWELATSEQRRRWGQLEVEYVVTGDAAYYKQFTPVRTPLVHHVGDASVLRFFQPSQDTATRLQDVQVKVVGMTESEQAELFHELKLMCSDAYVRYTHCWQDGDIIVADNRTLLHGREAFHIASSRHLRRINII